MSSWISLGAKLRFDVRGPQVTPYRCMTDKFMLPGGSYLGPSTDSQCSAATKVQYVYMSTNGDFVPMQDTSNLVFDVTHEKTKDSAIALAFSEHPGIQDFIGIEQSADRLNHAG